MIIPLQKKHIIKIIFLTILIYIAFRITDYNLTLRDLKFIDKSTVLTTFIPIISALFLLVAIYIYDIPLRISLPDILLFLYSSFQIVNYFSKHNYYNESLVVFSFSTFSCLLLKQLYSTNRIPNYVLTLLSFGLVIFGISEAMNGQLQILGLKQIHNQQTIVTGIFSYPGPYAILLGSILVYSAGLLLFLKNSTSKYQKLLAKVSAIFLIMVIPILPSTQSRSAWVGALFGIMYLLYIKYKEQIIYNFHRIKRTKWFLFGLPLFISFISIIIYLIYSFKSESVHGRMRVWIMTLKYLTTHAATGIGYNQFQNEFGKMQSEAMVGHVNDLAIIYNADYVIYVFNDFLQILIENGLIGFLIFTSYLYFILKNYRNTINTDSPFLISSVGGIIVIIIACLFSYPFEIPIILTIFLFFGSIISFYSGNIITIYINKSLGAKAFLILGIFLVSFFFSKEIYIAKVKSTKWREAENLYRQQRFKESVKYFESAYPVLSYEPEVLMGYGRALYLVGEFEKSEYILELASRRVHDSMLFLNLGDTYLARKKYAQAEKAYKMSILTTPDRLYPRYSLVNLYQKTGNLSLAKQEARNIIKIKVPVVSPASDSIYSQMHKLLK